MFENKQHDISKINWVPQAIFSLPVSYFEQSGIRFSEDHDNDFDTFQGTDLLRINGHPFILRHYNGFRADETAVYLPLELDDPTEISRVVAAIVAELKIPVRALTWQRSELPRERSDLKNGNSKTEKEVRPLATSSNSFPELRPPARVLLGPGPSNIHPRVMKAMLSPLLGHLDPEFVGIMEDIKKLLRLVFRTSNEITFPVSGTGSAGMECVMANLIEAGDEVVVGVNGAFGGRLAEIADRLGAKVHKVEAPWGRIIEPDQIAQALSKIEKPKLVAIVHSETSTGVHQPLGEISKMTSRSGALLVVDAVTSLGCVPLEIDEWGIDACYSCTQKGLGAPPGLSPVTFSERAMAAVRARKSKCRSWYLDVGLIEQYWGPDRLYHHTAPITMNYAIYEALRIVVEEGLETRFKRHIANASALVAGFKAVGIGLAAQEGHRLPQLTAITIPEGINDAKVRERLLKLFNIEIGAGLGPFKGKVWRIGLMGEGSRRENVMLVLNALEEILGSMGMEIARGRALSAADKAYESMELGAGEPR